LALQWQAHVLSRSTASGRGGLFLTAIVHASCAGLPTTMPAGLTLPALMGKMALDKKNEAVRMAPLTCPA
jgi:hypothetical protein